MANRKISNTALCKLLNSCKQKLDREAKYRRWFVLVVAPSTNWADGAREREQEACMNAIEDLASQIRDCEHAIAALDEKDTPNAQA